MTNDQQLITSALHKSGLTRKEFAERIIGRDERTVRRWLNGQQPIQPAMTAWLHRWLQLSDGTRERIVGALAPAIHVR